MSLAKMPKCFGLTELVKGWFPYFFASLQNLSYVGPYPCKEDYGYNRMRDKDLAAFLDWYNVASQGTFNLMEQLIAYNRSDVDIARGFIP